MKDTIKWSSNMNMAGPHIKKNFKETLENLGWDVLPHPLYAPDIARHLCPKRQVYWISFPKAPIYRLILTY